MSLVDWFIYALVNYPAQSICVFVAVCAFLGVLTQQEEDE